MHDCYPRPKFIRNSISNKVILEKPNIVINKEVNISPEKNIDNSIDLKDDNNESVNHNLDYLRKVENEEIQTVANNDRMTVKSEQFLVCPRCNIMLEVIKGGCKFITCYSIRCNGRFKFCHVCKNSLTDMEKSTHFPKGVYINYCLNSKKD